MKTPLPTLPAALCSGHATRLADADQTTMVTRTLGRSGLQVSAPGPGYMDMSWSCSPVPDRSAMLALLKANIATAAFELTGDDRQDIERAVSETPIDGARYPDAMERLNNR